ncbi:MAG: hypothetical protein KGL39_39365 [Patescibacteria group bacterium]|nr:hypothetical protein [Patescibacteria group bacterium]
MQVELNEDDMDVLDKALTMYERVDGTKSLMGALLGGMLLKDDSAAKEKFERKQEEERIREEQEAKTRRIVCAVIRSKLFSAQTNGLIDSVAKA